MNRAGSHPARTLGMGLALAAARKGYAPGPGVLCHFSNDDGKRAAMILRYGPRA